MALGQVGARTEGDYYQGLYFWWQAAKLFIDRTRVSRVVLEHDDADGVDDVAVFYAPPGVDAGGSLVSADFFQLKHHVDHRDTYSADSLMTPASGAKSSMLQRFKVANDKLLEAGHSDFRLHLVSNWTWSEDCPLRAMLDTGGALRDEFFSMGKRSKVGKKREAWRSHLGMDVAAFTAFARRLRFDVNFFGRRAFKEVVCDRFQAAGMRAPPANQRSCPYDSLIVQFLMDGTNEFERPSLHALCENEGLLLDEKPTDPAFLAVGVRSFLRFAENMEDISDEFVCVAGQFDGRHPREETSWSDAAEAIQGFFAEADRRARLRAAPAAIALECHGSIATLAGYELSLNSGVQVFPLQKGAAGSSLWMPADGDEPGSDRAWVASELLDHNDEGTLVVALSVTHDISGDVLEFVEDGALGVVRRAVHLAPAAGPGRDSVFGPTHADRLADQLVAELKELRARRAEPVHLFFAAPNAFMFALGRRREALGRLVLYEFDFNLTANGSYAPSISLPIL